MLEFQESFFEQEVRNGFYIDRTMKTVWAAELEVLQRVAEICDKYGIAWYAAYGTLLGAIRHEGFVPWDDDIDIWVKRKDYNRLLKVLAEELPREYEIKSPLAKNGYHQFHTLVNNGSFNMEEGHIRQYHGCPLSVGLDIFPLDYLPREDKEREMQKNLVMLATRGAQVASQVLNREYEKAENPAEQKQAFKEEVQEGIHYLEENCGVKIEHQLLENEEWYKIASEFGRWANYFAMMYGEEESDYLVNFVDYVRCPFKKFLKEDFGESYFATFENFMLPVPCGYEQILRKVFGAYEVIVRKAGTHEYPFYNRQLRMLKKLENVEGKKGEQLKQFISECILPSDEDVYLLPEWEAILTKENGKYKKSILFIYDISNVLKDGEAALNKLKEVLETFERAQRQVALWWRPQKDKEEQLEAIPKELAQHYQTILDKFKKAGWGICDETDNPSRAIKLCDAYYGDMNDILQAFQNTGKPVMLATKI